MRLFSLFVSLMIFSAVSHAEPIVIEFKDSSPEMSDEVVLAAAQDIVASYVYFEDEGYADELDGDIYSVYMEKLVKDSETNEALEHFLTAFGDVRGGFSGGNYRVECSVNLAKQEDGTWGQHPEYDSECESIEF